VQPAWFAIVDGRRLEQHQLATAGLTLTTRSHRTAFGTAWRAVLRNDSDRTVCLQKAGALFTPARSRRKRQWRIFLDQGACGWCGVKPLEALAADHRMQPVREQRLDAALEPPITFHRSSLQTVAWDARSSETHLVGFLRQKQGYNFIDVVPDKDALDLRCIEAWQEFDVALEPGQRQELDVLLWADGDDPYEMLLAFAKVVQRHTGRRFDDPPTVGMMTWYGYRTAIDENIILENASLVGELFSGYPQPMQKLMLLDHGWQEDANWGHWEADEARFSHGMAWLSKQLKRFGLELGLWYTPFCVTQDTPDGPALEPLLCMDEQGEPQSGQGSVWGQLPGHSRSRTITYFDGALDRVQEKWHRELARMKRWGCTYWKLDFFSLRTSWERRQHLGVGALYQQTWPNLRDAAGEDGHLAPCSCGTNIQLGYCDSIRIGSDIGNSGHWPGAWEEYRYGLATIAALWYKHRRFWINDPDSIQIGKGCSLNEARVRATMVSLSGGHLMVSEDLRTLDPARLEIIRRILPAQPTAARPLDLFENPFPDGYPSLWALTTPSPIGRRTALAVFNMAPETRKWTITPQMLGLAAGDDFVALEWWGQRWIGRYQDSFEIDVPPEDVAVIHAMPVVRSPRLLSVSHHITGNAIVESASFDRRTGILSGELATKAGLRVVISGLTSPKWSLAMAATYHGATNKLGGWQHELVTTGQRTAFAIAFTKQ
jgi:hypothetical protein